MEFRMSEMESIDRCLLIVKPKKQFCDWANEVEKKINKENPEVFSFEDTFNYKDAYLTPEFEEDKKFEVWLKKNFKTIFEEELASWYQAPELWPEKLDFRTFKKFFDYEFIEMVFDLG